MISTQFTTLLGRTRQLRFKTQADAQRRLDYLDYLEQQTRLHAPTDSGTVRHDQAAESHAIRAAINGVVHV